MRNKIRKKQHITIENTMNKEEIEIEKRAKEVANKIIDICERRNSIGDVWELEIPLLIDTNGLADVYKKFLIDEFSPMFEQSIKNDEEIERHRLLGRLRTQELVTKDAKITLLEEIIEEITKQRDLNERTD